MAGTGADGNQAGMSGNVFGALMAMMLASRSGVTDLVSQPAPAVEQVG